MQNVKTPGRRQRRKSGHVWWFRDGVPPGRGAQSRGVLRPRGHSEAA